MATLLDTPDRVLERVQHYEEMELPSLPSFQHDDLDLSDDFGDETDQNNPSPPSLSSWTEARVDASVSPQLTPSIARTRPSPQFASPTFTDLTTEPELTPLVYKAASSYEYTALSFPGGFKEDDSAVDGALRFVPSSVEDASGYEYSTHTSMTPDRLPLSCARSEGAPSESEPLSPSSSATPMPVSRMRRYLQGSSPVIPTSPRSSSSPTGSRIPSLSRTEASATDNEATTPDAPSGPYARTERHTQDDNSAVSELDWNGDQRPRSPEFREYDNSSGGHLLDGGVSYASASETPMPIRYMDVPSTAARAAATPFPITAALRDVTPIYRNGRQTASSGNFSPLPGGATSPPLLDDAARRKSHVLSVLASATLPTRVRRRATPSTARRLLPGREGKSTEPSQGSLAYAPDVADDVPGERNQDETQSNVSFVSIASSQDLATDRKGSKLAVHRGNTSVPDILLGIDSSAMSGNLNLENRPDTVKIHKHLNMMNRQLLDANTDLAHEAQAWRHQCDRLLLILKEAGIELEGDESSLGRPHLVLAKARASPDEPSSIPENDEKQPFITRLQTELQEKNGLLQALQSQLDQARAQSAEHSKAQQDYAIKTEEHVWHFSQICEEFEAQISQLQADLQAEKTATTALRTQLSAQPCTVSASEGKHDNDVDSNGDVAQDAIDDQGNATGSQPLKSQLLELRVRHEKTVRDLRDADREIIELRRKLEDGSRPAALLRSQECRLSSSHEREIQENSVADLERSILDRDQIIQSLHRTIKELELSAGHCEDSKHRVRELEAQLSEAQAATSRANMELEVLQARILTLELTQDHHETDQSRTGDRSSLVEALEDRLDEAYRQIGRLKSEREATPARLSAIKSRDVHISALESEKAALLERLKQPINTTPLQWPMRAPTPILHKAITSLRSPLTPGSLKECSWLQSSVNDSEGTFFRAQLEQLQQELDHANTQLDKNFDRLEEAGLGAVELAQKLAFAHDKIDQLEEELCALRQERRDSNHELTAGRTRNEQLEDALEAVRAQMSTLQHDMTTEKERLQEDNRRLRLQYSDMRVKLNDEMDLLRSKLANAEDDAHEHKDSYNKRVQEVTDEKQRIEAQAHERIDVLESEAQRLRHSLVEMAHQPESCSENLQLAAQEDSLRSLKADLLQAQAALVKEQQVGEALREQQRQQIIDSERTETRLVKLQADRNRTLQDLRVLKEDLSTQRQQCHHFASELNVMRQQEEVANTRQRRELADLKEQLRVTSDRLSSATRGQECAQQQVMDVQKELDQRTSGLQATAAEQRYKFKVQTNRLSAQVHYLKAKYARENTFRNALSLQKKFLLLLVGGMSLNEQATLRVIASLGCNVPQSPRPTRSFRAVALAVILIIRAQRLAQQWKLTRTHRDEGVGRRG